MIELTVALPTYKNKNILWISLESLINQKNINFDWELIIAEEQNEKMFGEKRINQYKEKLSKNRCKRVKYISLNEWIPLANKWKLIAKNSISDIYLLQAADCYSQPYRLKETYDIFQNDINFSSCNIGYFYNIRNENIYLYKRKNKVKGLNLATRTSLIRQIKDSNKKRCIDQYIVNEIQKIQEIKYKKNDSDNWKYGIDTDGLNLISKNRHKTMENSEIFTKSDINLYSILPKYVCDRLVNCKEFLNENNKEESKIFYDNFYAKNKDKRDNKRKEYVKETWKWICNKIENKKVIDLGCGPGTFLDFIKDSKFNINYTGVDYSKNAINICKEKHKDSIFLCDDINYISKMNYDVIVLMNILEHIIDDYEILNNIKEKKEIIISVPSFNSKSHVRTFNNIQEVKSRYENYIDIIDCHINEFKKNTYIFSIQGYKK